MSVPSNRSTAALVVACLVVGMLVVGGVAGQQEADTGDADAPDQDATFLRVAHVSPDAPPVDVYLDGEQVLADVSFGNVSEYQTLTAGDHEVRITPSGENETVFEGNVTLESRSATTLYAAGEVGDAATQPFEPILLGDDAFEPGENESAVSVLHLSPDAPAVDVTADGGDEVLAENVSYGNASEYVNVPAGNHTLEVRPATADNGGDVVATTNVSLEAGTAYSVLAIGYVDGFDSATGEEFRLVPVEDATVTIRLPGEDEETATPTPATETPTPTEPTPTATEPTPTATETPTPVEPTPTATETVTPATETPTPDTEPETTEATPEAVTQTPTDEFTPATETETPA